MRKMCTCIRKPEAAGEEVVGPEEGILSVVVPVVDALQLVGTAMITN